MSGRSCTWKLSSQVVMDFCAANRPESRMSEVGAHVAVGPCSDGDGSEHRLPTVQHNTRMPCVRATGGVVMKVLDLHTEEQHSGVADAWGRSHLRVCCLSA